MCMLNKRSQCEEAIRSIIPTICHTGKKNRTMEEGKRSVIARW